MNKTNNILKDYTEGRIGWREACFELRLWDLEDLQALVAERQLIPPSFEKEDEASLAKLTELLS